MTRKVSLGEMALIGEHVIQACEVGCEAEAGVQAERTADPKPSKEASVGVGESAISGRGGE